MTPDPATDPTARALMRLTASIVHNETRDFTPSECAALQAYIDGLLARIDRDEREMEAAYRPAPVPDFPAPAPVPPSGAFRVVTITNRRNGAEADIAMCWN